AGDQLTVTSASVPTLTEGGVPQVAPPTGRVGAAEPLRPRPFAHAIPNGVAELGRQPALLDLEHLVPPACLVKADRRPVLELREGVFELVPVVEDLLRGDDRLDRRRVEA